MHTGMHTHTFYFWHFFVILFKVLGSENAVLRSFLALMWSLLTLECIKTEKDAYTFDIKLILTKTLSHTDTLPDLGYRERKLLIQ